MHIPTFAGSSSRETSPAASIRRPKAEGSLTGKQKEKESTTEFEPFVRTSRGRRPLNADTFQHTRSQSADSTSSSESECDLDEITQQLETLSTTDQPKEMSRTVKPIIRKLERSGTRLAKTDEKLELKKSKLLQTIQDILPTIDQAGVHKKSRKSEFISQREKEHQAEAGQAKESETRKLQASHVAKSNADAKYAKEKKTFDLLQSQFHALSNTQDKIRATADSIKELQSQAQDILETARLARKIPKGGPAAYSNRLRRVADEQDTLSAIPRTQVGPSLDELRNGELSDY